MSLLGALNLGQASLAAQQVGLQVTGNNIANAGTPGYARQTTQIVSNGMEGFANGLYMGSGVTVGGIERQVSETLEGSLRDATADQNSASTLNDYLTRVGNVFGALNQGDLASKMDAFFSSVLTLANNPQNAGQQSIVVRNGAALADSLQELHSQLVGVHDDTESQIAQLAKQVNGLGAQIAQLNGQILQAEAGNGGTANTLRDQRDAALSQLAQITDVRSVEQGNGMITVMVGSGTLVQGITSRGVGTKKTADASGQLTNTTVTFTDNGQPLVPTSGQLGGLLTARDTAVSGALSTLDTFAAGLINTVNSIHTQGQGATGFANVTGTTTVLDANVALNAGAAATGLAVTPVNGTFNLYVKDGTTGQTTTRQIKVDLSGAGGPMTLAGLAGALTGGNITASVNATGHLQIQSNDSHVTFAFGEDSSGVLSTLGVNTFFAGKDAGSIAVNPTVLNNPGLMATGRGNVAGSNSNAQALALGYTAINQALGGQNLKDYYANYVGDLASQGKAAADNAKAQGLVHDTISAQREAYSGVSMDEEAINLTKYQRAFQGTARYITVVDQMIQEVLGLVR